MGGPLERSSYDIIIVGGGTAGCVLANRLTEDPNLHVLLLEAGPNANDNPLIKVPGFVGQAIGNPDLDWDFQSEPNPGLNGRRIGHPRGKCLGGSSSINIMALIYPSKLGMDAWAELGNAGWDWDGLKPYFRKFHTYCPAPDDVRQALGLAYIDQALAGSDGPIKVSHPQTVDAFQKAWVDSWKTLGQAMDSDPLSGAAQGGFSSLFSIDPAKAERSHAGIAYYAPVAHRENLHVLTGALVERIELEGTEPDVVARGVIFEFNGNKCTAQASLEIILNTGSFGSPQLLELSGIGSADLCQKLGIHSKINNPNVGENLQDHVMCGCSWEVKDGISTIDMVRDPAVLQKYVRQYQDSRAGPFALGASGSFAFTPLAEPASLQGRAELEILLEKYLPQHFEQTYGFEKQHRVFIRSVLTAPDESSSCTCAVNVQINTHDAEQSRSVFAVSKDGNYFSIIPSLVHPLSRGSVHIQSSDPTQQPKIAPNYLSHPLDVEILARHLVLVEKLAETEHLKPFVKPNGRRIPAEHSAKTLEEAIKLARYGSQSNYHPAGTCAMLPKDLGGVVNERLVVHGTKNLRVVDASIFPIIPRGNIQATVYAAAEKGADLIKEDLRLCRS